jgi:hypothetical protein
MIHILDWHLISKLREELFTSTYKLSSNNLNLIKNKSDKESIKKIIDYYYSLNSISGLEVTNQFFLEYEYLNEILNDLKTIPENQIKEFQFHISKSITEDFGYEDFRFVSLERKNLSKSKLKIELEKIISQTIKSLKTYNPNYSNLNNPKVYFKSDSDPSIKGVNVKLKQYKTPPEKIEQLRLAKESLYLYSPELFGIFLILTERIHIVQSKNLVSYSHFNEQGISYINLIDRSLIETIDDLVHENSHHHLNLLLKKYRILKTENKEAIFYSPWRGELRSIYGILHAFFTFTFCAYLFENLLSNEDKLSKNLSKNINFMRRRYLEEIYMLEYSLQDLKLAIQKDFFYKDGIELIQQLEKIFIHSKKIFTQQKKLLQEKKEIQKINSLQKELAIARKNFSL